MVASIHFWISSGVTCTLRTPPKVSAARLLSKIVAGWEAFSMLSVKVFASFRCRPWAGSSGCRLNSVLWMSRKRSRRVPTPSMNIGRPARRVSLIPCHADWCWSHGLLASFSTWLLWLGGSRTPARTSRLRTRGLYTPRPRGPRHPEQAVVLGSGGGTTAHSTKSPEDQGIVYPRAEGS